MSLDTRRITRFVPIVAGYYGVAAGAAGWIDVDMSTVVGTDISKIWLVVCTGGDSGVRTAGSSVDARQDWSPWTQMVQVSPTGHVEFYRKVASDNYYRFMGYLS